MKSSARNTFIAFMIAVLLAPGFYFGIAPIPQVQAQSDIGMEDVMGSILSAGIAVSACVFGSVINGLIDRAMSSLMTELAELFRGSIFAGLFKVLGLLAAQTVLVPIYISDTNFQLQGQADATMSMEFKECVLDGIVWVAKRILIDTITASVMDWIGKGFFEGPVFVRDPGEWARALAFSTADIFLLESGVDEYLCEPFREDALNTVLSMNQQPTFGTGGKSSCSFDAVGNEEGYETMVEEGTLTERGFLDALGLAEEGNNAYSAIYNLQSETAVRVNSVVASEMTILNYGDGYHSDRCSLGGEDFGICTPGQYIAKQVDDWAGGALGQLEVADEVSEIVDALFAHLTEDVFFDAQYGLLRDAPDVDEYGDASAYEGEGVTGAYSDSYEMGDDEYTTGSDYDTGVTTSWSGGGGSCPAYDPNPYPSGTTITVSVSSPGDWVSINSNWHPRYVFERLGPDYGENPTFTFSNGDTVTVSNSESTQMFGGDDDIKYQPGNWFRDCHPHIGPTMEMYWVGVGGDPWNPDRAVPTSVTVRVP